MLVQWHGVTNKLDKKYGPAKWQSIHNCLLVAH